MGDSSSTDAGSAPVVDFFEVKLYDGDAARPGKEGALVALRLDRSPEETLRSRANAMLSVRRVTELPKITTTTDTRDILAHAATQHHGAGPAIAGTAPKLAPSQPEILTQHVQQQAVGGSVHHDGFAIDVKRNR